MASTTFLSIIIPAYNEARRIGTSLQQIYRYLNAQPYSYELIVVDDGSADQTAVVVQDILQQEAHGTLLRNPVNRGKGYSVRRGVLHAQGHFVLYCDADLSTPIEDIEKLLRYLQADYDVAIGSRGLRTSEIRIHQPWYRENMGKMFNHLVRVLGLTGFSDTQCGFKCFRGEVARDLFARQTIDHFSFDVEVLFLAQRRGYRIKEVPIQWADEPHSRVHVLADSANMFKDLLHIRWNAWTGHYE